MATHIDPGNPKDLQRVDPLPIALDDSEVEITNHNPSIGPFYKRLSTVSNLLYKVQKYSSISFSVFTLLHGATVLVAPAVSTSLAEELLSMTRTIYQGFGIEETLVWGSLGLHVFSGIGVRLIRNIQYKIKYGSSQRRERKLKKQRTDRMISTDALTVDSDGSLQVNKDEEIGLTGGVTNMVGLGTKKSYSYRKFGMSPLQLSGYILIPFVLYHIFQTRLIPMKIEGDSSYVNLEYIAYILNDKLRGVWAPLINWIVYPLLTVLSIYHNIYGLLKWFNVKSLKLRKTGAMCINVLIVSGLISVYKISRIDISSTMTFVINKFGKWLDGFYYLSF